MELCRDFGWIAPRDRLDRIELINQDASVTVVRVVLWQFGFRYVGAGDVSTESTTETSACLDLLRSPGVSFYVHTD